MRKIDLTGNKYGRWTVLERDVKKEYWLCKCDCGAVKSVSRGSLKNGISQSCGCLRKERPNATKHGKKHTRLHSIWCGMRSRCYNPNRKSFPRYGGRGIVVYEGWDDFELFYKWSIDNGYADNLVIDRKNTNGNYEPTNCRWVTSKVNNRNRVNSATLTYKGVTKTVSEWSEELNLNPKAVYAKRSRGFTAEEILSS